MIEDLFTYARARSSDPETSVEAGLAAAKFVGEHHQAILRALRERGEPLAAEQIADYVGISSHVTINRRMAELVDGALIKPTELRHINRSGRKAIKYRLRTKEDDEAINH